MLSMGLMIMVSAFKVPNRIAICQVPYPPTQKLNKSYYFSIIQNLCRRKWHMLWIDIVYNILYILYINPPSFDAVVVAGRRHKTITSLFLATLSAGLSNQSVSLGKQTYYARGGHIIVTHFSSFSNTKETLVNLLNLILYNFVLNL